VINCCRQMNAQWNNGSTTEVRLHQFVVECTCIYYTVTIITRSRLHLTVLLRVARRPLLNFGNQSRNEFTVEISMFFSIIYFDKIFQFVGTSDFVPACSLTQSLTFQRTALFLVMPTPNIAGARRRRYGS